jgi:hypothetical protein
MPVRILFKKEWQGVFIHNKKGAYNFCKHLYSNLQLLPDLFSDLFYLFPDFTPKSY